MPAVPHVIIDDFLPAELNRAILAHTLQVPDFAPGLVQRDGVYQAVAEQRRGMHSHDQLGPYLQPFWAALKLASADFPAALGMPQFRFAGLDTLLVAHGDGDYFKPHSDTQIGANRRSESRVRMISAVYYFHRQPRGFAGGTLKLHPFSAGEPVLVEPVNNRLIAFPSFLIHEVLQISVPSGAFEDSRFSLSCWFDHDRSAAGASASSAQPV